jgi:hypothetical protein
VAPVKTEPKRLVRHLASTWVLASLLSAMSCGLFAGPYSGKAVDSQTGDPVVGASVLIYWTESTPGSTNVISVEATNTNAAGEYFIPFTILIPSFLGWHDETYIIIYEPGFQAYIPRTYRDSKKDSFKTSGNLVELQRIPPDFDHADHFEWIQDFLRGLSSRGHVTVGANEFLGQELLRRAEWEQRRKSR